MSPEWGGIRPLVTIDDHSSRFPVTSIGNDWSRRYYDGAFHLFNAPPGRPAISLVFVQSRDGNTGAANPSDLGAGPTDLHLIYEGLSRVAADAVLSGASSLGHRLLTVHHPELVHLRQSLGLPRHPVQIVLSRRGRLDLSAGALSTPGVPAIVLAGVEAAQTLGTRLAGRSWITVMPIDDDLPAAFETMRRDRDIARISAIGGAITATGLVDAGLVQDIYLTTSAFEGGEPGTPWYVGERPPQLQTVVRKREVTDSSPLLFEHFAIGRPG